MDITVGRPFAVGPDEDPTEVTTRLGHTLTEMLERLQQMPEHRPRPGEYACWYPAHLGGQAPELAACRELDAVPSSAVSPTWGPVAHAI